MSQPDLDLLKKRFGEQQAIFRACVAQAGELAWLTRLLVQSWLAEIQLMIAKLDRNLVQLSERASPVGLNAAWNRFFDILTALSPAAGRSGGSADSTHTTSVDVRPVGWRLQVVMLFLLLQLAAAIFLLGWSVGTFGRSDPQTTLTREQWEERAHARGEIRRTQLSMERADREQAVALGTPAAPPPATPVTGQPSAPPAAEPSVPDPGILRAEVEGLVVTLTDMRLAERDLRLANRHLENVLVALDKPDFADAARLLAELERAFGGDQRDAPPSPIRLILMGSLLGMITITIHLNWKYRNRWDTLGYLPWYLTRLIAAPVISLAALGLLFQVSFTTDLTAATDITSLGLRGASPLTIFSIAIVTGLFSNVVFDWLRGLISRRAASNTRPAAPEAAQQEASSNE